MENAPSRAAADLKHFPPAQVLYLSQIIMPIFIFSITLQINDD
jgi:hypothetical protein